MTCLLVEKPEVQAQLKEYTDILGSFDAAYYVLSENNGYGLEFNPDGTNSQLFADLLSKFGNSNEVAIREKSKIFTSGFRTKYADIEGEAKVEDVVSYVEDSTLDRDAESFFDSDSDLREHADNAARDLMEGLDYIAENETEKQKEELNAALKDINVKILEGLQARLRVNNNPDPELRATIKRQAEYLIANISEGLKDDLTNINEFLNNLRWELEPTFKYLVDVRTKGLSIEDAKLNDLDQNFFGFYNDIVDDIVAQLIYREGYREIIGKNSLGEYKLDTLLKKAKNYQAMLSDGYAIVKTQISENARNNLRQVGLEVKAATIYEWSRSNPSASTKDIGWLTYMIGAGDKIKDDSIKTIFYLIDKAERESKKNTYATIKKLEDLLNKAGKFNQKQLFEVDDDGNTTGYIVRSRNYGKFEKNYKAAMDKIALELGLDITDMKLPENRAVRIEYNRRRNEWLSKHTERRYTKEYYDLFNHLSQETVDKREEIQLAIRNLVNKTRDQYGIAHLEKLTDEEYDAYKMKLIEKKQLASLYNPNGTKKQGIQLTIAEELIELNKKLSEGLTMSQNSEAFEAEKAKVMSDSSLSKAEKQKWLDRNTRVTYKKEFYDKLEKLEKKYYGPVYSEYSNARRAILSQYRDDFTGGIDIDHMPKSARAAVQQISRHMSNIRKNKKATVEEGLKFEDIAETVPTEQWYRDLKKHYYDVVIDDPVSAEMWLKQNAYNIKNPKAWYTKMVPRDKSLIERVPNNNWLEVSKESKFINDEFSRLQEENEDLKNEYWIPKEKVKEGTKVIDSYDNSKNYNKIKNNKNLNALRDGILEVIKESNDKLTNLNKTYPFRLPQKSGSIFKYIKAGWKKNYIVGAFKGYRDYWKDKVSVKNDDVGFNKQYTKPNGEKLSVIPQYYLSRLENPEYLTANLVGSVIDFYKSCENWKQKSLIQPQVEILKRYVQGRKFLNRKGEVKKESNTYKFVKSFIDMNLYDVKNQDISFTYGNNPTGKLFGLMPYEGKFLGLKYDISGKREINVTKMLSILRGLGTLRNLGLNFACALTGAYTAIQSHIVNALTSRWYNPIDAAFAMFDSVSDAFYAMGNVLGVTREKSFLTKSMELFEIGAEMEPNPTNRLATVNMISKHWAFGAYSLMDHVVKGQILASVMHNYKLVEVNGKKVFMSREDYKRKNKLSIYTPGDYMDWNLGNKKSFYDAVEFVGGRMVAKDKENQEAVEEAMDKIAHIARTLAQSADGQLTPLQRPVILSNWAGQFVMMHRQYLPVILQERWLMERQWDYQAQRYREGMLQSVVRLFQESITRNENIISTFKKLNQEDSTIRENLAKAFYEGVLYFGLIRLVLRPLLEESADDDKRNIIKQLLAYVIMRAQFESLAPYNLYDMVSIVKSPSAIVDYVGNMFELLSTPFNMAAEQLGSFLTGQEPDGKTIKRGAYKGWKKWWRNLFKLTPFRSLWELQDIQSKRNYYKKQILQED